MLGDQLARRGDEKLAVTLRGQGQAGRDLGDALPHRHADEEIALGTGSSHGPITSARFRGT